jgi:hypothetical protein
MALLPVPWYGYHVNHDTDTTVTPVGRGYRSTVEPGTMVVIAPQPVNLPSTSVVLFKKAAKLT